jgi:hypothetical protein|tara:strand:- start:525 stop:755 length:231 start_codon:yes stop_codon:yes gene_type:complete
MHDIRKIAVGVDYKTAMHYVVGQDILHGSHTIHLVVFEQDAGVYKIYIEDNSDGCIFLWKSFTPSMPVSVEYNIEF